MLVTHANIAILYMCVDHNVQVVVSLQKRGIAVWMVTGDNTLTALTVASQLSIPHDRVMSQVPYDYMQVYTTEVYHVVYMYIYN
jgi:magnesium-transporting ATPase (P-type)